MAALVLGAATLVRTPPSYGDEPWIASEINSFVHGSGLRPSIFTGSGLYDQAQDAWNPYLGTVAFMVTAVLVKPTLLAYRLAAFVIGLLALGTFAYALRRFGTAVALAGTAALAMSWGFISASHYVRWDSLAFAMVAASLAMLLRGPPGRWTALCLGGLLGASLDVQASVLALVPGAAVLLAWQRAERWTRLALFGAALAAMFLAYFGVHYLSEPSEARRQWHLLLGSIYTPPLERAIQSGDPSALFRGESKRYDYMTFGLSVGQYAEYGSLVTLAVGAYASLLGLGRQRFLALRSGYPLGAVPAILFVSYLLGLPLLQGNKGAYMYAWYALPLAVAALATLSRGNRRVARPWRPRAMADRSRYERLSFAFLLVLSAGLTALVAGVLPSRVIAAHLSYEWYALPFVFAAIGATWVGRWPRNTIDWALWPLLTLAIAAGGFFISDLGTTCPGQAQAGCSQIVTDSRIVSAFHRYVGRSDTVLAQSVFWWVDPSPRFRAIATIKFAYEAHGWSLATSLRHLCPSVIVFDQLWLNQYLAGTSLSKLTPGAEEAGLNTILNREYVAVGTVQSSGDDVRFWRRRSSACGPQFN